MNRKQRINLPEAVPHLNTYYFYLTHGCNLACRHCWLSPEFQKNDGSTGGHLDFNLFKQAIDEGIPLGLGSAKLTGGEPLLHPDFVRMVDYLNEKEIRVTIETNGTLLTKDLAVYLKENSTAWFISVSIDGANAQTHDRFRGVKGAFDKSTRAIRYLSEAGYKPQLIMSIHEGNVSEIEETVRLAESLGAGSVKFNLIQPTGRGKLMQKRHEVLDIHRLIEIGDWIERDLQKRTSIPLYYSWPMAFDTLENLLRGGSGTCGVFSILGILSSGHYALCGIGVHLPDLVYGQIGVDKLEDVWVNNTMLHRLRQDLPDKLEGVCHECIFRDTCLGSCVASMYHRTGRMTASDWFCQCAYDEGLFPESRFVMEAFKLDKN